MININRPSSLFFLNISQYVSTFINNIYKMLVIFFLIELEGEEASYRILATASFIFVLPFFLFSASSGILADRFSKRNVIVITKFFEFTIMIFGIWAFSIESKLGSYFILFLLSTESAIFGPSKYGIIPELVPTERISAANGILTSLNFLGLITGTFAAPFLLDISGRNYIFTGLFCSVAAFIGFGSSLFIEKTPPGTSLKRLSIFFLGEIYDSLKTAAKNPALLIGCIASAFFLFIVVFVQLNMIPFAIYSMGMSDLVGGYLFMLVALGIGIGSLLAGKISGKRVELGITPLAMIGVICCLFLIDIVTYSWTVVILTLVFTGIFSGLWIIPLDAYIQIASPIDSRGQIVAAKNFLSFIGVLGASLLIYASNEIFKFDNDTGFTIAAIIMIPFTVLFSIAYIDYIMRFIGMLFAHLHYHIIRHNPSVIPNGPALYFCHHAEWDDTLMILGAQDLRMRFFIENPKQHSKFVDRLFKLLKVFKIPEIKSLETDTYWLETIENLLESGISVCIFTNNTNVIEEYSHFKNSAIFKEIIQTNRFPALSIKIQKGPKRKRLSFLKWFITKLHIPTRLYFEKLEN